MTDNSIWAQALQEAESPELRDKGLWAKSFAEAGGDESKAKAAYVNAKVGNLAPAPAIQREGFCPNCGEACRLDAPFCSKCKAVFSETTWRPTEKRRDIFENIQPRTSPPSLVKSAKSRGVYVILGLFFGLLGVHNFYAGRFAIGVWQLLITCVLGWIVVGFFITAAWVLIELFVVKEDGAGDAMA